MDKLFIAALFTIHGKAYEKNTIIRLLLASVTQIGTYLLALVGLVAGFFGMAKIASAPMALAFGALVLFSVVLFLGSLVAARLFHSNMKWRYAILQTIVTATLFCILAAIFIFRPLIPKEQQLVVSQPEGVEFWDLPTGSTVAVRKIAGTGPTTATPIIILHGGPGAYSVSLKQTVEALSPLKESGHDVYFYDQVGSGLSEQLDDISEYSLNRHIADLKALFNKVGTQKFIGS